MTPCQIQAYQRCPGSWQDKQPYQGVIHLLVHTSVDTDHRESENLHTSRCSWKFPTMWSAPLVALGLECIRQIWCYVAMNRSCFLLYFLPDAGKMAHVQTTVQVWSSWIDTHQRSGQRGSEWRGESSCRRILNVTFNGYFNPYIADITFSSK